MDNSTQIATNIGVERAAALALIALGVALRLWIRYPTDFWEDEIIASTHAVQPFWHGDPVRPPSAMMFHRPAVSPAAACLGMAGPFRSLADLQFGGSGAWPPSFLRAGPQPGGCYGARAGPFAAAILAVVPCRRIATCADQLRMYTHADRRLIDLVVLFRGPGFRAAARSGERALLSGGALLLVADLQYPRRSAYSSQCCATACTRWYLESWRILAQPIARVPTDLAAVLLRASPPSVGAALACQRHPA